MKNKLLLFLFLIASVAWGQTTVTKNFSEFGFSDGQTFPSGNLDGNISFTTEQNDSGTEPAYFDSDETIRLYPGGSNGGSITLNVNEGYIITSVTFISSRNQPIKYFVDGGEEQTMSSSDTYTINENISNSLKFQNANTNTSGGGNQLRLTGVEVTYESATTDPIFNTSSSEITGLGYMEGNGPSASQSFSLSGMNLEPASGNITVTAPADFQVSTDDISFSNSLNIAYTDGALAATDIYVRLNESLMVGAYNGDIEISGGSANATVSVEGIVTEFSEECGFENFDNAELTASYTNGEFTNNGITWTYGHSRNAGEYEIDGKGLMLRNAKDSYLEATISGGIGTFSFDYRKAFTGENVRQLELLVDGVQVATTEEFGGFSGEDDTIYNLSYDINTTETVTIKIKNVGETTSNRQTVIDNITWTCYSPVIWTTDNEWSNLTGPTINDDVVIEGDLFVGTDFTSFEAKSLTVVSGGAINIESGSSVTVAEAIDNQAGASNFIVESGANLVQINDDAVNEGEITVEKLFTFSSEREQYNFVMSPVEDQNVKEIYDGDYIAQFYRESDNKFVYFNGSAEIEKGKGRAIEEPSDAEVPDSTVTAHYQGKPHNGVITVSGLTNENTGFHLAGNPYPSQLDLDKFYEDNKENIESRFLFWDNRGNEQITQYGDGYNGDHYAKYNALSQTGVPAQGETVIDTTYIPTKEVAVGNGFMLRLLPNPAEAKYVYKNAQRTIGSGQNFLGRNYSTDGIVSSEMDRYWLTLNTPNNVQVMNAVVYFEGGNDEYAMDDSKSTAGSDAIYTLVDEHQLAIQGKSSFDVNDKIKLGYKAYAAGIHTISIYDKEGVFADGQKIFIRDFQTGIVHELTQSDFTFKTFAGEFNDRFEIFYKRSIKASENKATLSNVVIYQNENHIQIAAENQLLSDVEIYDLNGVSVYQATDINLENWQVPNHLFGKGILVVVVKTADGEVVNKKLINK